MWGGRGSWAPGRVLRLAFVGRRSLPCVRRLVLVSSPRLVSALYSADRNGNDSRRSVLKRSEVLGRSTDQSFGFLKKDPFFVETNPSLGFLNK